MPFSENQIFLDFPGGRARVAPATLFRSTWLTSSLAAIRERGHFEKYHGLLDAEYADAVLSAVAGMWLPMDVAIAHYDACDRLELPNHELVLLGESATRRASATTLAFTARLATQAGITPWAVFAQAHRLWAQTCQGGGVGVYKLGPKEARVEIVGFPLSRFRYNRVTMRGIVQAAAQLFCTRVYANEIPGSCGPNEVALRVSWV